MLRWTFYRLESVDTIHNRLVSNVLKRVCFHPDGSQLNVMSLTLSQGLIGIPHMNKTRDEAIILKQGMLDIYMLLGDDIKIEHLKEPGDVTYIEGNIVHQFLAISTLVEVIEVIEGKHEPDSCVSFPDLVLVK